MLPPLTIRSCSAFLKIPSMKKTKGKIAAAVGKIPYLSVEGIKEKTLPLSAFSGLRGVVGSEQENFQDKLE